MSFKISEKANCNYLAKIIEIDNLRKHPNADRLQITTIDGNNIITGLDAREGRQYVYFPLECAINKEFLSHTNSFQDSLLNRDTTVKGYFPSTGRVRATKLRGEKSEGYIVPISSILDWLSDAYGISVEGTEKDLGSEFDTILDIEMCRKYVVKYNNQQSTKVGQRKKPKVSRLVDDQFHFHIDTRHLKKFISDVNPEDYISITRKLHGTSAVFSKILCLKPLKWYEKLLKRLGVNIVDSHYDLVYSSRKVVKNGFMDPSEANFNHYYTTDIWGHCARKYDAFMKNGISLYGEIVGYTPDGAEIQKGYDYGCGPKEHDFYVYRVTYTSVSGDVYEMSPREMKVYCERFGIKTVPEIYYGNAKDFYNIPTGTHWHENFLQKLCDDYLEKTCDLCNNNVPDEGICLRVDKPLDIEIYKLKSFAFLERETKMLDKGEVDMETIESEEDNCNE